MNFGGHGHGHGFGGGGERVPLLNRQVNCPPFSPFDFAHFPAIESIGLGGGCFY